MHVKPYTLIFLKRLLLKLLLIALFASAAHAWEYNGRLKFDSITYDAGDDTLEEQADYQVSHELTGQLRLELSQTFQAWQFQGAWQVETRYGSAIKRDRILAEFLSELGSEPSISFTPSSYWDWQDEVNQGEYSETEQVIDRLSVSYTQPDYVIRLGRQTLTWGSGLVFHPMDLVNPFQPVANDTAYKRGTDMTYGQWLFINGADIQGAFVPHRQPQDVLNLDPAPEQDGDSYALFATAYYGNLQWNVLLAQDYNDTVLGIGASGSFAGAVWNVEMVPTRLDQGSTKTSILINVSQAGTLLQRNLNSFAEYYHNGLGETKRHYSLLQLNDALIARLSRGQQFVTGRDYLAMGTHWEWSPLLQLSPTVIFNLHDNSSLFDAQINYSLSNNLNLKGGVQLPFGSKGTEFGGLELLPASGIYLSTERELYFRGELYF